MKKIFVLSIISIAALSLTACGDNYSTCTFEKEISGSYRQPGGYRYSCSGGKILTKYKVGKNPKISSEKFDGAATCQKQSHDSDGYFYRCGSVTKLYSEKDRGQMFYLKE